MPRIEIIPYGWETSQEKARGEGTPTIDVCVLCGWDFIEGESLCIYDGPGAESLDKQFPGATIGSTEVDHPPYEEADMEKDCECCGKPLDEGDN